MQQEERHETYESRRSPERDEPRERSPERRDTGPERREEDDADGTNLYVANLHFDVRSLGRSERGRSSFPAPPPPRAESGAGGIACAS